MIEKLKTFLNKIPRHLIVAASAWISRAVSAFIQIISVRALLLYLGEERYAVYVIVYSLIGWFSLCDLGFGIVLLNRYSTVKGSVLAALLAFTLPQILIASIPFIKIFKGEIKNLFKIDYSIIKERRNAI
jgi:O-antigen/teichoic acid export membrane protein